MGTRWMKRSANGGRGALLVAWLAMCVLTCAGPAATTPASQSPTTASSASPIPSPSLAPSASVDDCKLPPLPDGPGTLTSTEPDLHLDLPEGYRGIDLSVYRRALSGSAAQQADPAAKRDLEATIRLIDTGEIRGIGYGRAGNGCAQNVITFRVPPKADSLEAAVAAWREEREGRSAQYEVMSRKSIRLSVGPAVRILVGVKGRASGATFGRAVVYLMRLDEGEVVELNGGAPFGDSAFDALVDATAESLRAAS